MTSPEVCCGFGGTFCVKYPEISNAMVSEKSADIAATGADTLLAGDLGCLMNMAGKLQREGSAVRVRHVAEVLAGMGDQAADRRTGSGQTLMESTAHDFKDNVDAALADPNLQDSLAKLKVGLLRAPPPGGRAPARVRGAARSRARHQEPRPGQPRFLSRGVRAQGDGAGRPRPLGADAPRTRAASSPSSAGAWAPGPSPSRSRWWPRRSRSTSISRRLGIAPIETDLGEYIIQLRHEPPSHIIAPAVHLTKDQVADTFLEHHSKLGFTKRLTERNDLVAEARYVLRQKFLDADVGLTGANFLVAETGSSMLVTNEGNADLSNTCRACTSCWPASRR